MFLDNAQDLVQRPPPSHGSLTKLFNATVRHALSHGVTAIHDAGISPLSLYFFRTSVSHENVPFYRLTVHTYSEAEHNRLPVNPITQDLDRTFLPDRTIRRSVSME